ncbi:MAG TPA: HisA/HisF-related TIM barrel protein [Vicinamibacterales bacterium]|nr:HisA/HisF-related TIM barrel protein [Vicinamibacterales bacterium]
MLIPAIDLQGGRVVQLVQGERLALAFDELDEWLARFAAYPLVQVIDLDAAMGRGNNDALLRRACAALPCRVGGGVRSVERGRELLRAGAREVIVGSALFAGDRVNVSFAAEVARALGREPLVAAVDSRDGRVTLHGWRVTLELLALDAVRALEPFVGGFLQTIVEREGLMGGIDLDAVRAIRGATDRRVTVAGGIRSREEIQLLHDMGVDAVVGMALYTGKIDIPRERT